MNNVANDEQKIQRLTHDKDYVFNTNGMTELNAENLLIGKRGTLDFHFQLQTEYEEGGKGEEFVTKAKFKFENMAKLVELMEKFGLVSNEAANQLKKCTLAPILRMTSKLNGK